MVDDVHGSWDAGYEDGLNGDSPEYADGAYHEGYEEGVRAREMEKMLGEEELEEISEDELNDCY